MNEAFKTLDPSAFSKTPIAHIIPSCEAKVGPETVTWR